MFYGFNILFLFFYNIFILKTWENGIYIGLLKLECGPMPNVMAALSNIGGTIRSTPQSLAEAHYYNALQ